MRLGHSPPLYFVLEWHHTAKEIHFQEVQANENCVESGSGDCPDGKRGA